MSNETILKSEVAFSFCFSFTDFQLEMVSKALRITYRALRWQGIKKQMFNKNKNMIREIKVEDITVSPACTTPPLL